MTRLLATISLITTTIFILAILILHFLPTGVNPRFRGSASTPSPGMVIFLDWR